MTPTPLQLDDLNRAAPEVFAAALATVFEDAPWVPARAAAARPFATVSALHQALFDQVERAGEAEQRAFLGGHPDLAGTAARQRTMGEHSTTEQAALGLDRLDEPGVARFTAMNEAYRARFGIPFLICVRRHTLGSIIRSFERRLGADPEAERRTALQEVFFITRLRVAALVQGPGMPVTAGSLSTHVLDTARGRPGAGIAVEIFEHDDNGPPTRRNAGITDGNGRVSTLLDDGGPLRIGTYELHFHLGTYFAESGLALADPPYLDVVPVRIAIAEAESHYHVPLLASPYGYTTYRGN